MASKSVVSKRLVREWFDFYRDLLGLGQWKIKLKFCKKEVGATNALAVATINEDYWSAIIRILKPSNFEEEKKTQDIDETVVHELVHIRLFFLEPYREKNPHFVIHEEQSIKAIAKAFVALRRRIEIDFDLLVKNKREKLQNETG